MLALVGRDSTEDLERFGRAARRVGTVADELDGIVAEWVARSPRDQVLEALGAARIPAVPVQSVPEVLAHPQVVARDAVVRLDEHGRVLAPAPTPHLSHSPARISRRAPELDADHDAVLHDWLHPRD
jgi:crotonobetainyl-CoA:carnitine CoA-transferase CaiB-like acyl-CoA transferase